MGAIAALALAAAPVRAGPGFAENQLLNGDFEGPVGWGGSDVPPEGWLQVQSGPTPFSSPQTGADAIGGSGRSLFLAADGQRGYVVGQGGWIMGPRWRLELDFAIEDPATGVGDEDTLVMVVQNRLGTTSHFTLKFTDNNPDDGMAELVARNPTTVLISGIPNLFDDDVSTSPLTHSMRVEGHWDVPTPYYDVFLTANDGSEYSATGVTVFANAPAQGDRPGGLLFVATNFETADAVVDNVRMGAVIPLVVALEEITVGDATGYQFDTDPGAVYRLERGAGASPSVWVDTGARVVGDGGPVVVFDPAGHMPGDTYRVVPET